MLSIGIGTDVGVSGQGEDLKPDAQPAPPSAFVAALAGSSAESDAAAAAFESGTSGQLIAAEVDQGEKSKSFEESLPPKGDMAAELQDPAPPWIEHVNKEELASAVRRRERAGGVASNGAISSIPRASFGHVALSSDEVRIMLTGGLFSVLLSQPSFLAALNCQSVNAKHLFLIS